MGQREPSSLSLKIKRISRGDIFYDITHIKNITNGIMGQSIIADAQSIDDGNSIADAEIDVNPDTQFSTRTTEDDVASMSIEEMDCAYMDAVKSGDEQWDRENCPLCPERTVPSVPRNSITGIRGFT